MTWDMLVPRYVSEWMGPWYCSLGGWLVIGTVPPISGVLLILWLGRRSLVERRNWGRFWSAIRGIRDYLGENDRKSWLDRNWGRVVFIGFLVILDIVYMCVWLRLGRDPNWIVAPTDGQVTSLQNLSTADFRRALQLIEVICYWGLALLASNVIGAGALVDAVLPDKQRLLRREGDTGSAAGLIPHGREQTAIGAVPTPRVIIVRMHPEYGQWQSGQKMCLTYEAEPRTCASENSQSILLEVCPQGVNWGVEVKAVKYGFGFKEPIKVSLEENGERCLVPDDTGYDVWLPITSCEASWEVEDTSYKIWLRVER
jgi:hypothetical protein